MLHTNKLFKSKLRNVERNTSKIIIIILIKCVDISCDNLGCIIKVGKMAYGHYSLLKLLRIAQLELGSWDGTCQVNDDIFSTQH